MLYLLLKSAFSIDAFYHILHRSFITLYGENQMLHYPIYKKEDGNDVMRGQMNFTDHCVAGLPELKGKRVLDIGCGNGVQTLYIAENYKPEFIYGVDINELHVKLAKEEKQRKNITNADFSYDNSQILSTVPDNSFDYVINTESAFHYPDKEAFLKQINRVLKPGGQFVIADLLRRKDVKPSAWEKRMKLFNWPYKTYTTTFNELNFKILKDEDITQLVMPGFHQLDWFENTNEKKRGINYRISKIFARSFIKFNINQLNKYLQYHIFVGQKPA